MTDGHGEKLIKARRGMLALVEELHVSLTCKRAGISRTYYYEIKEAFEKYSLVRLMWRARSNNLVTPTWPARPSRRAALV